MNFMYRSVTEFCETVRSKAAQGERADALRMIIDFVTEIISLQCNVARVFSSRDLDILCQEIGDQQIVSPPEMRDDDRVVYLVTELCATGGHTRVLSDIIRAESKAKQSILVSNILDSTNTKEVFKLFQDLGVELKIAPPSSMAEKLAWMQQQLYLLRPAKTYMLIHHFDAVSVAAAQKELVGQLNFFHNCDHSLALGVHIPHVQHIDCHAKGFYGCRERDGIHNNVFWPLTAEDKGHRADLPFYSRGHLTTCTSGGFEKFEFNHYTQHSPYLYDYGTLVPLILKTSKGSHVHIGKLSERLLKTIKDGLKKFKISDSRFIYKPYVPSLWEALLEMEIDLYVGSFPLGGGRATIEALGAGLPMIVHNNYRSVFFSDLNEAYEGAMVWRQPQELFSHLQTLTNDSLKDHAKRSRRQYEENHTAASLKKAIMVTELGGFMPTPKRPQYHPDILQLFLDESVVLPTTVAVIATPALAEIGQPVVPTSLRRHVITFVRHILIVVGMSPQQITAFKARLKRTASVLSSRQ